MEDSDLLSFFITEEDLQKYKRLDAYLSDQIEELSRTLIKKLFLAGKISAGDNLKLELKKMPPAGCEVLVEIPPPAPVDIEPQNIPLDILYEDKDLIIINKQPGLVVHPAPGNYDGTLVNAILYHCPDLAGIGHEKRPGIVHRLDKGTSGVMVVAKSSQCHEGLVNLFGKHDINRFYEAVVLGVKIPSAQTLESTIGRNPHNRLKMAANVKNGKEAITHMKVLSYYRHFSHVELKLETGRTHQIRVHLSQLLNSPIVNDQLYGREKEEKQFFTNEMKQIFANYEHPLLHAKTLGFVHPITKKYLEFTTEPPPEFQATLASLKDQDE